MDDAARVDVAVRVPMPRLAIFDFDGTLADTWPWFVRVLDEAALRFGFRRIDAAEAERLRGLPSRKIVRALAIPWWKVPRVVAYVSVR